MKRYILKEERSYDSILFFVYDEQIIRICNKQKIMKVNQELEKLNSQQVENQQQNEKFLSRIKNLVVLSNADMLQLIQNQQKFVNKIVEFNQISYENMKIQENQKASIYLQQAEKILEYAASCGKTIDRFLIITTLHNEATVYHKLLEFSKSYDYMEAILFNMQLYFHQNQNIFIGEDVANHQSHAYKQIGSFIYRKINTVAYSLQFSAVCSQIDKHDLAIQSAKKALALLHSILLIQIQYSKHTHIEQTHVKKLKSLSPLCLGIDKAKAKQFHIKIRQSIKQLRQNQSDDKMYQKLKKFSIGEVMQMQPISVNQANQFVPMQILMSSIWLGRITFYISIAYYTIATQMRLEARKNYIHAEQSQKFQKSKIFHLNAIMIAFQYIPLFSDYHEHIIRSFKTNYHIDLSNEQADKELYKIKQAVLEGESFVLKHQKSVTDPKQQKTIKKENDMKPPRLRRTSSQSIQGADQNKNIPKTTQFKQKRKKTKSKQHETMLQSREVLCKNKIQIHKIVTQKSQRKLITMTSRTKLGKASKLDHRDKIKTGNSNEKTKDQSKKQVDKKEKNRKRIMQQYMTFPERNETKKLKNSKKTENKSRSKQKSKSSKSKGKNSFLSPRASNSNYGIKSFK